MLRLSSLALIVIICFPVKIFSQTSNVDSATYFFEKGMEEKAKGRKLESVKNFEKSVSYNPKNKAAYAEIATAYLDMKRIVQARDAYKKLESMGGATADVYSNLTLISFQTKKWDDLIAYSNKLKAIDPAAKVNYFLGKMYFEQGDYGRTISHLEKALVEDKTNAEVHYLIGHCFMQMMNFKKAIPYYQEATRLNAKNGVWLYELSLVYHSIYDDKNSLKYMLLAGENGYPKNSFYLENLGMTYMSLGDTASGFTIMREILAMRPSDLNLLNSIAETYYDKMNFLKAIEYWDKVMYHDDNNPKALYMIGLSYQRMGQKDKGMQLCDKAIELDPSLASLKSKKSIL